MKLARVLFFAVGLSGFSHAKDQTPYGIQEFLQDFSKQYTSFSQDGLTVLQQNKECLRDQFQKDECKVHQDYLQKRIPDEVRKYRLNLALSRWSHFLLAGVEKGPPFETDLKRLHKFSEISALSPQEIQLAQKQFQERLEGILIIWKENLSGVRGYEVEKSQALKIVETWPFALWFRTPNVFLNQLRIQIEKQILNLSKMRVLNQLAHHPILAYLTTEKPTSEEMLHALDQLTANLNQNTRDIHDIIKNARVDQDLDALLDSVSVLVAVRAANPHSADYIEGLMKSYHRRQLVSTILMLGGSLALTVMAPPAISVTGMAALQAWTLSGDLQRLTITQRESFTNVNKNYSQGHLNRHLQAQADYKTSLAATPLLVVGVPLLRVSKLVGAILK